MMPKLVHESQKRQLCAVHTINNLLQLSPAPNDTQENDECRCSLATKEELDRIADELTLAENDLLRPIQEQTDQNNAAGDKIDEVSHQELSISDLIFSKHRTVWWGNYSFEVSLRVILHHYLLQCYRPFRYSSLALHVLYSRADSLFASESLGS